MLVRDVKEKLGEEEKKKEKPKAHAPSHTKIRSIGKPVDPRPSRDPQRLAVTSSLCSVL